MGDNARGYSWPPFEPGNVVALKAGDGSPRIVAPLAAAKHDQLVAVAPWTAGDAFAATRQAWAWVEAQCDLLRRWLDEHGLLDDDGVPRPASVRLDKLERRAQSLRAELGLSPLALARLMATIGTIDVPALQQGYAAMQTAGAELVEAARRRGDLPPAPDTEQESE